MQKTLSWTKKRFFEFHITSEGIFFVVSFLLIFSIELNVHYQLHPESWKWYLEEKEDKYKARKKNGDMIIETEMTQKRFHDALVRFIIKDLQPLSRVESPAFRQLLLSK